MVHDGFALVADVGILHNEKVSPAGLPNVHLVQVRMLTLDYFYCCYNEIDILAEVGGYDGCYSLILM